MAATQCLLEEMISLELGRERTQEMFPVSPSLMSHLQTILNFSAQESENNGSGFPRQVLAVLPNGVGAGDGHMCAGGAREGMLVYG